MKIRIDVILALGLALGCAGADEFADELGTAEQALTASVGYGGEKLTGNRCLDPWNLGVCFVPKQKVNKFVSICDGCSADESAGFASGISQWRSAVQANGFTINDAAGQPQNIFVRASGVAGTSYLLTTLFANSADDVANPLGTYKRWSSCEVVADFVQVGQDIAAGKYGVSCVNTSQCKQIVYANWTKRALGVCTGLGFSGAAGTLMQSSTSTLSVAPQSYTAAELGFLSSFQP
jgi:hypothetical protein